MRRSNVAHDGAFHAVAEGLKKKLSAWRGDFGIAEKKSCHCSLVNVERSTQGIRLIFESREREKKIERCECQEKELDIRLVYDCKMSATMRQAASGKNRCNCVTKRTDSAWI